MIYRFTLFLFLISYLGFSQQNSIIAAYQYSSQYSTRVEMLTANQENAFYQIVNRSLLSDNLKQSVTSNDDGVVNVINYKDNTYANFIFSNNHNFSYTTYLKNINDTLLVSDDAPVMNWKLKEQELKIGRFNCKKAELDFRGRKWTAYYTIEIPIPFGPFKFKGLPGLIISIESNSNGENLKWSLLSLKMDNVLEVPLPNFFQAKNVTLKEVLEAEDLKREVENKRVMTKLGRGIRQTNVEISRLGPERVYEWELENEKN